MIVMEYLRKLKKPLITGGLLGFAVIVALFVIADYRAVALAYARMDFRLLPLILLLAPLNYLLRFVKWNYYLKLTGLKPQPRMNLYIFMSGLSMTVTPVKVGELLKCYLLKEHIGAPVSSTSSIVLSERVTDGLGIVILASCGLLAYPSGKIVVPFCAAVLIIIILFLYLDRPVKYIAAKYAASGKNRFLLKTFAFLTAFQQSAKTLLAPLPLLYAVGISVVSWGFEGLIVYLAILALGGKIAVLESIFIVSFSSLVGTVTFLPGGLGAAEGSIMAILILMGVSSEMAAAATIITRFSTLWLGVMIGIAGLALTQREFNLTT